MIIVMALISTVCVRALAHVHDHTRTHTQYQRVKLIANYFDK